MRPWIFGVALDDLERVRSFKFYPAANSAQSLNSFDKSLRIPPRYQASAIFA
jgi:hypothetical protein